MSVSEVVTFSNSSTIQSVQVTIMDDLFLEIDEVFIVSLSLENPVDVGRVELRPISVSVIILDADGECA